MSTQQTDQNKFIGKKTPVKQAENICPYCHSVITFSRAVGFGSESKPKCKCAPVFSTSAKGW
jgi:hypothetical protein